MPAWEEHCRCTVETQGSSHCFQRPLSVSMAPWQGKMVWWQGRTAPLPGGMVALGLSPYWEVKQLYISWCNAFLYTSITACTVQRPKLLPRCRFKLTQSKNKYQPLLYNSNSCEECKTLRTWTPLIKISHHLHKALVGTEDDNRDEQTVFYLNQLHNLSFKILQLPKKHDWFSGLQLPPQPLSKAGSCWLKWGDMNCHWPHWHSLWTKDFSIPCHLLFQVWRAGSQFRTRGNQW